VNDPSALVKEQRDMEWERLTLTDAAALIQSRALSPVELTRALLERIDRYEPLLNSFIAVTAENALAEAERAEREIAAGLYRGPLHGIPLAVKDLIDTAGIPTTCGARFMAEHVPEVDATVVTRLKEAGAVLLGKLNLHEFAYGVSTINPHYGATRNPWDPARIPGGSSGGSGAAVAATLCLGALGTDTGGSIRIPAALCGVVGLKPTYGRVSRSGVFPLGWSLDHVGPLARRAADCACLLQAIAGPDPRDPTTRSVPVPDYRAALTGDVRGLRVGVPREYFFEGVDLEVEAAFHEAIEVLELQGASVREIALPHIRHARTIMATIIASEAYSVHEENLRSRAEEYGSDVRARLRWGECLLASHYLKAQRARQLLRDGFTTALREVDLIATPATPVAALPIESIQRGGSDAFAAAARTLTQMTGPFNLTGLPALSIPCGFTGDGLPIGLQLAARPFDESTLLNAAHAYEEATAWHTRRPELDARVQG
jgi:aspartyl-tRNA(Asn)/glutamyl-tRNA(Gln) amidotransferase subunit A